jgi:hypothetical protein
LLFLAAIALAFDGSGPAQGSAFVVVRHGGGGPAVDRRFDRGRHRGYAYFVRVLVVPSETLFLD